MNLWLITYLPASDTPGVRQWVFEGNEDDLNKYLNDKHSCSCPSCRGQDWWATSQACEYVVERISGFADGDEFYNG